MNFTFKPIPYIMIKKSMSKRGSAKGPLMFINKSITDEQRTIYHEEAHIMLWWFWFILITLPLAIFLHPVFIAVWSVHGLLNRFVPKYQSHNEAFAVARSLKGVDSEHSKFVKYSANKLVISYKGLRKYKENEVKKLITKYGKKFGWYK